MRTMKIPVPTTCRQGFTLIEISIVLVIIGLLSGGVLAGRELIRSAQIRKQITELKSYDLAVNAFQLKYNCLPGDCNKADELGVGDPAVSWPQIWGPYGRPAKTGLGGDGSGAIDYFDEAVTMWYHLFKAGMHPKEYPIDVNIITPGVHTPSLVIPANTISYTSSDASRGFNAAGGVWYVAKFTSVSGGLVAVSSAWLLTSTVADGPSSSPYVYPGVYSAKIASQFDIKIDDGRPYTGNVLANSRQLSYSWFQNTVTESILPITAPICVTGNGSTAIYNVSSSAADGMGDRTRCTLAIKAGF